MVNAHIYRHCVKSLRPQSPTYLSPLRQFSSLLPHHPGGKCFGLTPGRHPHISRSSYLTHGVSLNNPSNHLRTSGGPQSLASLDLPSNKQNQSKSSRHNPEQLWPLVRAVIVQSICSSPLLVRLAPILLYHLFSTPSNTALRRVKSFFTMPIIQVIKVTLFEHFVPSDSLDSKLFGTLDSLAQPSAKGHGGAGFILNFAAEPPVDHKGSMTAAEIRDILEQNLEAIRAAQAYKAFVAIKVVSHIPFHKCNTQHLSSPPSCAIRPYSRGYRKSFCRIIRLNSVKIRHLLGCYSRIKLKGVRYFLNAFWIKTSLS